MAQFLPTFESKDSNEFKTQSPNIKNDQSPIDEPFIDENIEK